MDESTRNERGSKKDVAEAVPGRKVRVTISEKPPADKAVNGKNWNC